MNTKRFSALVLALITLLLSLSACGGKKTPAEEFAKAIYNEKFENMKDHCIVLLDKKEEGNNYLHEENVELGQTYNGSALHLYMYKNVHEDRNCTCDDGAHKNGASFFKTLSFTWYLKSPESMGGSPYIMALLDYRHKDCDLPYTSFKYGVTIKDPAIFISAVAQDEKDIADKFTDFIEVRDLNNNNATIENWADHADNIYILFDELINGVKTLLKAGTDRGYDLTVTTAE